MSMSTKQAKYLRALQTLDYYFEGAMIPYVLLKDTAEFIRTFQDLDGLEELQIGVIEKTLSKYSRNTLRDRFGEGWENKTHTVDDIPVNIKLIKRNYGFFKNLDTVPYNGGSFHIANPFEKYWKARNIIK